MAATTKEEFRFMWADRCYDKDGRIKHELVQAIDEAWDAATKAAEEKFTSTNKAIAPCEQCKHFSPTGCPVECQGCSHFHISRFAQRK